MAVANPTKGTLYIYGEDENGAAEELQLGSTTDNASRLKEGEFEVKFQERFGKTMAYRDAPSLTNNLKHKGSFRGIKIRVTKAQKEVLEDIMRGNAQFALTYYQDVSGGTEEIFYFNDSDATLLNGTAKRTAKKMKFTDPGITFESQGQDNTEFYASFEALEENG
jgi:hypothetical protein